MADNINTEVTEGSATPETPEVPETPAPFKSFATEADFKKAMEGEISKAVNGALKKQRETQQNIAKDNTELTNELAELKAELARSKNTSYVANEVNTRNIPPELTELFYAEDEDASKDKLDTFVKWYKDAVDNAVEARLNSTKAPTFTPDATDVSTAKKPKSSLGFQAFYDDAMKNSKKVK